MLELRLIGQVVVVDDGIPIALPAARERALLARLGVAARGVVQASRLVEDLWGPQPPRSAVNALQVVVSNLRRLLGADVIETVSGGYRLGADVTVDLEEFDRLVRSGTDAGEARDAVLATTLLSPIAAGVAEIPLADVSAPFAAVWRDGIVDRRLRALEIHAESLLALGQTTAVIDLLGPIVADRPYREQMVATLALALGTRGRQTEALALIDRTRRILADDLGVDVDRRLDRARVRLLRGDLPIPARAIRSAPRFGLRRLPAPMVGRTDELDRADELRQQHSTRLMTIIGPAGVGKTRFAQELAAMTADRVAVVSLAALRDPADLLAAILGELGLAPADGTSIAELAGVLAAVDAPVTLVLDGFDHVLDAAPIVEELLVAVPMLRCIVTSRSPLRIAAERRVRLDALPSTDARSSAVLLLRAAIEARDPDLRIDASVVPDLVEIAGLCGGLPLALELAAARTNVLSISEVAARLRASLRGLDAEPTAAGAASLDASVRWSVEGLTRSARTVLDAATVCSGGFTREAVAASAGVQPREGESALAELLDRSLVQARSFGAVRWFTVLEPIREVTGRLVRASERDDIAERHLRYYSQRFGRHRFAERFPATPSEMADVAREMGNLRVALGTAHEVDPVEFARLVAALARSWTVLGRPDEWRAWREELLGERDLPPDQRFDLLLGGDWPSAEDLESASALVRDLEPERARYLLALRMNRAIAERDADLGRVLLATWRAAEPLAADGGSTVATLQLAAAVAALDGDHEEAVRLLQQGSDRAAARGLELTALLLLRNRAEVHLLAQDWHAAKAVAMDAVLRCPEPEHRTRAAALASYGVALLELGEVAASAQSLRTALELLPDLMWEPESDDVLLRWAAAEATAHPEDGSPYFALEVWRSVKARAGLPAWPVEERLVERFLSDTDRVDATVLRTARDAARTLIERAAGARVGALAVRVLVAGHGGGAVGR